VDMTYYEAGHMMYVHHESLIKLAQDLRNYYNKR
jgi:carboxypeptidase C (cathepsin A)